MLPSERLDFSPIGQRSKLELPDGARLAVWVIVNVEEWVQPSRCRAPC
jgi:allantoinase